VQPAPAAPTASAASLGDEQQSQPSPQSVLIMAQALDLIAKDFESLLSKIDKDLGRLKAWSTELDRKERDLRSREEQLLKERSAECPRRAKLLEQVCSGLLHVVGYGPLDDEREAIQLIRPAAEDGLPEAQYALSLCFSKGFGVQKDAAAAAMWCEKAAAQGYAPAQVAMGFRYLSGDGVPRDVDQSLFWHRAAAEQNYSFGLVTLAHGYLSHGVFGEDLERAMDCLRKAAELGSASAQFKLAELFWAGSDGVKRDVAAAAKLYAPAALQGDPYAQCGLGECYASEEWLEHNEEEAVKWYRAAAERGVHLAQLLLGECYRAGKGVPRDIEEGEKWLRLAHQTQDPHVLMGFGYRYFLGVSVAKDEKKAIELYRRAASAGSKEAVQTLAAWYRSGLDVTLNAEKVYQVVHGDEVLFETPVRKEAYQFRRIVLERIALYLSVTYESARRSFGRLYVVREE